MRLPPRLFLDFARDVARGPAIIMGIVLVGMVLILRGGAQVGDSAAALQALHVMLDQSILIMIVLLTNHIVSGDRDAGYYRAYFSKPVDRALFYVAKWVVGLVCLLLFAGAVSLALGLVFRTVPFDLSLLALVALRYAMLGGLIFLISTVVRHDTIIAIIIFAVQAILRSISSQTGGLSGIWRAMLTVLPPFHLVPSNGPPPSGTDLAYVAGYIVLLLAATITILKLRPMGSGGRA